jgi:predicted nucleic acid-binding protein
VSFLLDTNVLWDLRKPRPNAALAGWFADQDADELFLSVVTLGEIRQESEQLRSRDALHAAALDRWLTDLQRFYGDRIVAIDQDVAEQWGRLRAIRSLPVVDALIAATARVHGLTIVTRSHKDFAGLPVDVLNPATQT